MLPVKLQVFNLNYYNFFIVWILLFFVTLVVILMVQLVLLPFVFTSWHVGDGLLVGGDWTAFHRTAVAMAEEIKGKGWSAWELRPNGWMPAGIAGAVYALTTSKPWVLAPLNAAVHATTILLVIKLITVFCNDRRIAVISALPFAFFPSAMLWYTQIHRDGYQILGTVMFLFGLILIIYLGNKRGRYLPLELQGFLCSSSGIFIIWLVRPHSVIILQFMSLLLLLIIAITFLVIVIRKRSNWTTIVIKLVLISILVLVNYSMSQIGDTSKYQREYIPDSVSKAGTSEESINEAAALDWERVSWLPKVVDDQLYAVSYLRSVQYPERYGETASGIDYDRVFNNFYDFVLYLPRAFQIAFFAPFPSEWFDVGGSDVSYLFRKVSALEMTFIYIMYPFIVYGIWLWRNKIEMWVTYIFCTFMMLPIVYSVPNVGTVYRYRYGYLMLMVAIGVAAILELRKRIKYKAETVENKNTGPVVRR